MDKILSMIPIPIPRGNPKAQGTRHKAQGASDPGQLTTINHPKSLVGTGYHIRTIRKNLHPTDLTS